MNYDRSVATGNPSTLSKAEEWNEIPSQKMHFKITVGDKIDPQPFTAEGEQHSEANCRLDAALGA